VPLAHATHHGWCAVKKENRRSYRRVSAHLLLLLLLLLLPRYSGLLPGVVTCLADSTPKTQRSFNLLPRLALPGLLYGAWLLRESELCTSNSSTRVLLLSRSRRRRLPMRPRRRRSSRVRRRRSRRNRALARPNQTLDRGRPKAIACA
jgi:hypothetical protein